MKRYASHAWRPATVFAFCCLAAAAPVADAQPPGVPAGPADVITGAQADLDARANERAAAQRSRVTLGMRQLSGRGISLTGQGPAEGLPAGTIRVRVADLRADPVAGATIRLGIMRPDGGRDSQMGRTDAQGIAMFTGLPTGETQAYRVNLANSGTQTSTTPFRLDANTGHEIRILSLPVTTEAGALFVMELITQVTFKTGGRLHVVQQASIANGGDSIVRLPSGDDSIHIDFPEGFTGFQSQEGMGDQQMEADETGMFIRGSVPPGAVSLLFGYDVPLTRPAMTVEVGVPMRVMAVQVIGEWAPGITMRVDGLPDAERREERGPAMLVTGMRREADAGALGTLRIRLDGIPGPGPGRWVAIGLAVAFALLGFYWISSRDQEGSDAEIAAALEERKADLVAEVLDLDADHAAGEVGPGYHERERRALIDELAAILKAEQASGSRASGA